VISLRRLLSCSSIDCRVERRVEPVGRVALHVLGNVGVSVERLSNGACPRRSCTTLGCTPSASSIVAQVWRKSWRRIGGTPAKLDQLPESPCQGVRVDHTTTLRGKDEVGIDIGRPRGQPLLQLPNTMAAQTLDNRGQQRDATAPRPGLRLSGLKPARGSPAKCAPHRETARVKVDIGPAQAEQFPAAHAGEQCQPPQRFEVICSRGS
jgi:hypothetical protein